MKSKKANILRQEVAKHLGREASGIVVADRGGIEASAPVLSDEIAIQRFVEMDCGADSWTFDQGQLCAVKFTDGAARVVKRYRFEVYGVS